MNEHDSERLAGLLVADGLVAAPSDQDADVIVLNTCTIRENADLKLYSALGQLKALKEARPDLQIAVGGCMAQRERGVILERAEWVDVVFGTHNLAHAPALLRRARDEGPLVEVLDAPDLEASRDMAPALYAVRELPFAAWMTIQTGCDNTCAYCIVPAVRGGEISRPFDDLVHEAQALARSGVTEITVLGQNVNSYGRDLTKRRPLFADLLRALGAVEGIERLRFTSPHPKDLRPETIAAMAETPAVCPQLHLPLQSGSNRVLRAMRRGYSVERYLERLASARAAIPDLAVTTDLIVGFPGETDEEFDETLSVVAACEFDSTYTFIFSPREGTRAAEMTNDFVGDDQIKDRFERLKEVTNRSALRRSQTRVGAIEEVLVEGPSRRDPAVYSGRTRHGRLIHFSPTTDLRAGALISAEVTSAAPYFLRGVQREVLRAPRHKIRVPLLTT
ncbi:MAG: tRNA (N6-isopentenyl adenosine(37)-C2)-methylthiotransferase MiaB [Acidobacteriota bacterium]|nr:tRNA (N6-isopentenyl adenosine(37)-C2)-methylthiotransferase MiaB [Acidobacteriota bacterium]MDE3044125.1 tRNA (N6-isopentenyl adenosine(37)-C2)-methylthiotransferase MiaB [Acidobacteriota bacterium]MDE3107323.1 tRNA (N6-isopentenyl adenosine(37)-C2)-methylthiotransferase MiaB [Acidobacteriota bacterium]